jgi:hypothetical protein
MKLSALAFALLIAGIAPAMADDAAMHAAEGFYGVYRTFHPSDGIPNDGDRAKYHPFLSPRLETLLKQAADADARFTKANKDSPPLIEGDLFSSMFEGATAVSIGACSDDGKTGSCAVNLRYEDPANKPTQWTDKVYLVNTADGWKVDDIGYGASWAFANKGLLSKTLDQVIHFQ